MASKQLTTNMTRELASAERHAATHRRLEAAYGVGSADWPAFGKADAAKAGGHAEAAEEYEANATSLTRYLSLAAEGATDAAILAAGYEPKRYRFLR